MNLVLTRYFQIRRDWPHISPYVAWRVAMSGENARVGWITI